MFLIHLIFVLGLLAKQSCSDSTDFVFDSPDLTAFIESDQNEFQIEAFKSSFNDKLIEENQTGFQQQLKWTSLGKPMLFKTTQNNITRLFHDSSNGFYTFIKMFSNNEGEILAKEAKGLYGFVVNKDQIIVLPLISFKCKIIKSNQNAFNDVLYGKVTNFNQNPLRLDFMAPLGSEERLAFVEILLNNVENDVNLDCTVKAKEKKTKTNEIKTETNELENFQIKEKLFGKANQVYLTPNQLNKMASELYFSLNINTDYGLTGFCNLFFEEIIKKLTRSGFNQVSFDEAVSSFPKYSRDMKPIFEQMVETIKSKQNIYLSLNTEKLEELKSQIDIEKFSLESTISYLNSNKRDLNKPFLEQLNDLNKETKDGIQWKREGVKILPDTLFVAKLEESLFSKTIKINKMTLIERNVIESEFETQFRLYSKSDIINSDEPILSEEITKCQISLNESIYETKDLKSNYDLKISELDKSSIANLNNSEIKIKALTSKLNEKNLEIEICKKEINSSKNLQPKHELTINELENSLKEQRKSLEIEKKNFKLKYDQMLNEKNLEIEKYKKELNIKSCVANKTLTGHTNELGSLALLQDGTLASGSSDTTIRIWNVKSGETIKTLTGHTSTVCSLAVFQDGSSLL